MIPNFALSLSFDGIRLLQQVPDGWDLVGEVPLDVPDLTAALEKLRATALRLAPDGLRTKLVIPPDQIRFMTLETAQTSLDDVKTALEGQTPYALDELVIDFDRHGGRTHIAAVARETLAEAEAFAVEHKFSPVAFVAVPEPDTFEEEVFFGPARAIGREEITRDSRPVVQTGVVNLSTANEPAPTAVEVKTTMPPPQTDVSAGSAPKADATPVFSSRARPAGRTDAQPVADEAKTKAEPVNSGVPGGKTPSTAPAALGKMSGTAPALAGVGLPGQPVAPVKRPSVRVDAIKAAPVEPLFTRRKEPPPPAPAATTAAGPDAMQARARIAAATDLAATPMSASSAPQRKAVTDPEVTAAQPPGKSRFLGLILTAILLVVLLLVGLWASSLPPDGIAGWFRGSDKSSQTAASEAPDVAEEPTEPSLTSTPVLTGEEDPVLAESSPVDLMPETDIAATPDVIAEPGQPVVRAPAGRVLSPAEADRIYAATGVYQRAPRLTLTPRTSSLDGLEPVSLIPTPAELPRPDMPVLDVATPDAALAVPVNPPGAGVVFERDANGNILATPDGTLMPDGAVVFARAPDLRPVSRPRSTSPINPDAANAPKVPTVLPRLRPDNLAPATTPEPAMKPETAEPSTTQMDGQTDGMIAPTIPVKVTTGLPPLRPLKRPVTFADLKPPAAGEDTKPLLGAIALNDIRPRARPGTDTTSGPLPAYTGLRPVNRPEGLAPEAVEAAENSAEPEPEPQPVTDINAVAAAIAMAAPPSAFTNRTRLAVSVTPRPDSRPRNFAQVVASARTSAPVRQNNPARTTAAAAVATPAPPTIVAPNGTVPGGVARAATQEDAINLRQMNLVGVYGKPNQRRALVRLGNGRYVKVEVGSNLDGGRVTAIGDSALNFVKRGRTYALVLPTG